MRLKRRHKGIIALAVVLLMSGFTQQSDARRSRPNNYHFWSVGVSGGYSTLLEDYPDLNTYGSFGCTAHFGYEYENQGFWVSPMIELQYLSCTSTSAVHMDIQPITDTQGKQPYMHYDITSPLRENMHFFSFNIPIMAGYFNPGGFYFGAGFRLGFNIPVPSTTTLDYTTYGEYSQYFDDFRDMPNHYYTNYTAKNDTAHYNSVFKVSVVAEVGYDVLAHLHKSKTKFSALRIGAFIEYGLNNTINTEGTGSICTVSNDDASKLIPRTYYSTYHTKDHRVVPLYTGIKLTYLFYIKGKGNLCPRCKRRYY